MTDRPPPPWRSRVAMLLATLAVGVATGPAQAQAANDGRSVYRCADGRYTDAPCPGGRAIDASDPRSAEQQRQARDAAAADARQADQLRQERQARERAAAGQPAGNLTPPPPAASRPLKPRADGMVKPIKPIRPATPRKPKLSRSGPPARAHDAAP